MRANAAAALGKRPAKEVTDHGSHDPISAAAGPGTSRPLRRRGCWMSIPAPVAEARAALARQLASWRQHAGLTQAQAGRRIGYSRSAVARAEATGVCSRDFCRAAGRLYGAGEQLALAHDRIEALTAAARSQAARQARQARQPPAMAQEETEVTFAVSEGTCPYCSKPVAVLVRQSAALRSLSN